jgi:hypothetical protein
MSVKLPCGCKDTTMCPMHEAEWYARHKEWLLRQAADKGYTLQGRSAEPDFLNID